MGIQGRDVKQRYAVYHEASQMLGGQIVAQPHFQIEHLLVVHGFEGSTHAHQYTITAGKCLLLSDKLLGAGKEDYDRLTELVEGKLIGKSENELLIAKYLDQPESWQNTLKSEFEKVNIDQDKEILNAAKRVTSQFMQKDVVYDRVFSANNATQKQLDQIVEQCSKQAKQWFRYSLLAAILGFVVILGGVILAILTVNVSLGFLTSLASIVPNVASLLFFRQANNANKRLDNFYKELVRIASIYKATELTLTTPIETQDGYKELIIKKWLSLYDAEKT